MHYYLLVGSPFLLVIFRLLLTNILVPRIKKKAQIKQLCLRADWVEIEPKVRMLTALYKDAHAKRTSIFYRTIHLIRDKAFIYGEIDFLSFFTLLERASPSCEDIFYDLGSGSGKAVLSAALFFNVKKSIGIELLPPLYELSNTKLKKITFFQQQGDGNERPPQGTSIQFINGSFLEHDFSHADIIYVAATCLSDAIWEQLVSKMAYLKPGARVIVATRTINHPQFESIYQGVILMSWGLCPVGIYKVKPLLPFD